MGKIRIRTIGTSEEKAQKEKVKRRRQTKKEKTKKPVKGISLKAGQRVVDMTPDLETIKSADPSSISKILGSKRAQSQKARRGSRAYAKKSQRSSAYLTAKKLVNPQKSYAPLKALELLKKVNFARFDSMVEIHINTTETGKLCRVSLPYPPETKSLKILVLSHQKLTRQSAATRSDLVSIIYGNEKTIDQIASSKKADYDLVLAAPDIMPKIAKIAKILGPKKLMPNPKNKTITANPEKTIQELTKPGKLEIKTEAKFPLVHLVLGKLSTPLNHLEENISAILHALGSQRIQKAVLKTTMSPGIKIAISPL